MAGSGGTWQPGFVAAGTPFRQHHREDRLLHFGAGLVFTPSKPQGIGIVIIQRGVPPGFEEEPGQDVPEIITVSRGRLHGPGNREHRQLPDALSETVCAGVAAASPTVEPAELIMLIKTHRIALVTNNRQASLLARHAGFARFAYNSALADFKAGLDQGEWRRDRVLQRRFNAVKRELAPWSVGLSQNAAKYAIADLGQAIDAFGAYRRAVKAGKKVRRVGFPRFHRRSSHCSFRADNGPRTVRMAGKAIRLPKIGTLRTRETLRFAGVIAEATVTREAGRWYACVTVRTGEQPGVRSCPGVLGVDVGIKTLATCSDARTFYPVQPERIPGPSGCMLPVSGALIRPSPAAKISSVRTPGPTGRGAGERRYLQRQRIYARIKAIRNDAHHKATSAIVAKPVGRVVVETLNVSGMLRNRRLA